MIDGLTEEVIARIPAKDAVIAVGIDQLPEILISLDQRLHILCRIAIMHIVVGQPVTEEQSPMQLGGSADRIHLVVSSLVLLRSTHIPLRIDGVIKPPACRRGDGDTSPEDRAAFRHRHQRIPATIRPTPDTDTVRIDKRLLTQP